MTPAAKPREHYVFEHGCGSEPVECDRCGEDIPEGDCYSLTGWPLLTRHYYCPDCVAQVFGRAILHEAFEGRRV